MKNKVIGFIIGVLATVIGSFAIIIYKADDKKIDSMINSAMKNS